MPQPGSDAGVDAAVFLFNTTHAAMEAEEAIIDAGFWCDIIPRPPAAADSLCGLAIEVQRVDMQEVELVLEKAGLVFEVFESESD